MLTPSIEHSLEEVFSSEWDTIGFEITEPVPIDDLHESRNAILGICKPAPDEMIIAGLAKLRALTASRARDDRSTDIQIEAYIEQLKMWPADAVVQALNDAPSRSKWFPTWHELEEQLKYLTTDRRLIVAAIDRRIARLEKKTSVQGLIQGAIK
jgi:hypothetical protein